MSAKVGKHTVVHTQSLICPDGEDGLVSFTVGGWEAKLTVRFVTTDQEPSKQGLQIEVEQDQAVLKLVNWKNSLGTATIKPVQFATLNSGAPVYFMATHWRIGTVNRLDLQFLLEDK